MQRNPPRPTPNGVSLGGEGKPRRQWTPTHANTENTGNLRNMVALRRDFEVVYPAVVRDAAGVARAVSSAADSPQPAYLRRVTPSDGDFSDYSGYSCHAGFADGRSRPQQGLCAMTSVLEGDIFGCHPGDSDLPRRTTIDYSFVWGKQTCRVTFRVALGSQPQPQP